MRDSDPARKGQFPVLEALPGGLGDLVLISQSQLGVGESCPQQKYGFVRVPGFPDPVGYSSLIRDV